MRKHRLQLIVMMTAVFFLVMVCFPAGQAFAAKKIVIGKLVITLEGGYHLGGLRDSVKATLKELTGNSVLTGENTEKSLSGTTERIMEEVRKVQKDFWTAL